MPVSLLILATIALVLHILFVYYLNPTAPATPPRSRYFTPIIATIVIVVVLLLWFVLPVHVGG